VNDLGKPSPRPITTTMRFGKAPPGPPQDLQEHVTRAIDRVQGISARQKVALIHSLMQMMRDVDFLHQLAAAAKAAGPFSAAAVQGTDGQGNTWT
jgi:hypothetical protein